MFFRCQNMVSQLIIFLFVWNCTEELIRGVSVITHTLDLDLDFHNNLPYPPLLEKGEKIDDGGQTSKYMRRGLVQMI